MKKKNGFSLLELMIAVSMIAILVAVAAPAFRTWVDTQKMIASAQQIKNVFENAKSEAIKNQNRVVVSFSTGTGAAGTYRIFIDNGTNNQIFEAGDQLLKSGSLTESVTLYQVNLPGGNNDAAEFNLMGLAPGFSGDVRIRNNSSSSFRRITLSDAGSVRVEMSSSGADNTWAE